MTDPILTACAKALMAVHDPDGGYILGHPRDAERLGEGRYRITTGWAPALRSLVSPWRRGTATAPADATASGR